jgi:signal transduction histidine kinase
VLGVQIFELFRQRAEPDNGRKSTGGQDIGATGGQAASGTGSAAGTRAASGTKPDNGTQARAFDRVEFWKHSLAVGCAARLIAEKRLAHLARTPAARNGWPLARPEEAFVCGLLHDLGKVVFDACFPRSYGRVIERTDGCLAEICDVERDVFGIDHAIAGYRLAQHWSLPQAIAECIWLHHQTPDSTPTRIAFPDHVLLVQAADRLARQMQIGYSGTHASSADGDALYERLGLDAELLQEVMLELPEGIELRAEVLGLQEITSSEVLHESLVKTNTELARVNAALSVANRTLQQRSRTLDALCLLQRSIGDDCRHETVLQALAPAVQSLASGMGVGAFVSSPARQLTVLSVQPSGQTAAALQLLPNTALTVPAALRRGSCSMPAEAVLPAALLDRVAMDLGQHSPLRCWAVPCDPPLVAGVVTAGVEAEVLEESLQILGNWAASWLNAAESAFVNRRLTEELAEINHRFVSTQAQVARMRSLTMIGEMAAGAAHELNNPLTVISGRAQLLARSGHGEEVRKVADIITENAHRASNIVTELMNFAKPDPPEVTDWAVGPFLQDVRQWWVERGSLTAPQFSLELSDDLPAVHADARQIRTVFDEIIRNAVQAMGETPDRRLIVNCRCDIADERLVIRIEDNGCGMTPDVAEHAMDPFFSHRPAGRGRGLGLSRAARLAEINGGGIRLSSRAKEGTAVIVELPAAAAQ